MIGLRLRTWALRGVVAVLLAATTCVLASCTSPRSALGPPESPCFRAIPVAHVAVNSQGHFGGVRYLTAKQVESLVTQVKRYTHGAVAIPAAVSQLKSSVCAVAYRGHFDAQHVAMGWSPTDEPGEMAIVVVKVPAVQVIITIVTGRAPLGLTKLLPSLV